MKGLIKLIARPGTGLWSSSLRGTAAHRIFPTSFMQFCRRPAGLKPSSCYQRHRRLAVIGDGSGAKGGRLMKKARPDVGFGRVFAFRRWRVERWMPGKHRRLKGLARQRIKSHLPNWDLLVESCTDRLAAAVRGKWDRRQSIHVILGIYESFCESRACMPTCTIEC